MSNEQNFVKRYFENKYSVKDYQKIKTKFEEKPSDPSFVNQLQQYWMELSEQEVPDKDMENMLQKVQHRIFLDESRIQKFARRLNSLQRIAAILFLPLLISSLVYFFYENKSGSNQPAWAEIQCPKGVRTHFQLPDGSSGYLNSGSTLTYQIPFTSERKVKLEGEAYFDVVHDKNSPFHVKTNDLDVKVLGTKFNVSAFGDLGFEEVTLEEGKVEVYNNQRKLISTLAPDQQFNFNRNTGEYSQKQVSAMQYTSWISGKLIFRDEKFDQVAKRLGRWYNADIVIADKRLNDYVFHATFENEQLEDVLDLIELTTPITYELQKREKLDDGSFQKKKVILNFSEEKLKEFK